jgi:hypothetical protein
LTLESPLDAIRRHIRESVEEVELNILLSFERRSYVLTRIWNDNRSLIYEILRLNLFGNYRVAEDEIERIETYSRYAPEGSEPNVLDAIGFIYLDADDSKTRVHIDTFCDSYLSVIPDNEYLVNNIFETMIELVSNNPNVDENLTDQSPESSDQDEGKTNCRCYYYLIFI